VCIVIKREKIAGFSIRKKQKPEYALHLCPFPLCAMYTTRVYIIYIYIYSYCIGIPTDRQTEGGGIARKKGKFKKLLFGIIQSYFFESRFILNLTRVLVVGRGACSRKV